ncbi:MAG: hypothetical protein ACXWWF_11170 [Nitrospira sp.]
MSRLFKGSRRVTARQELPISRHDADGSAPYGATHARTEGTDRRLSN